MIGNLLQFAKQDAAFIAGAGGFQVDFLLTTTDGNITLAGTGLATGTWKEFMDDSRGKPNNSTSFSFDIPEAQLIAGSYPYRNTQNMVHLVGHKITLNDGAGMTGNFVIAENHYNATTGLVICTLGRAS